QSSKGVAAQFETYESDTSLTIFEEEEQIGAHEDLLRQVPLQREGKCWTRKRPWHSLRAAAPRAQLSPRRGCTQTRTRHHGRGHSQHIPVADHPRAPDRVQR